tara:strand:+ start:198 stop:422 length:225 start_codon:yes stop_codon:yes gene_type:complete
MELVILAVIVLAVVYKLGLFGPVLDLSDVATRESSVYNREHKIKVAKRYETAAVEIDVEKVNDTIAKIDSLNFN